MSQEEDINKLQMIQQNLSQLAMQRQQFQQQLNMVNNALSEVEDTKQAYKIIGGIMVAADQASLKKDLGEKKEMIELRIKNLEKQEERLNQKTKETQEKVMNTLKK